MRRTKLTRQFRSVAMAFLLFGLWPITAFAAETSVAANKGIDDFNQAFAAATRRMDNAAVMALWDEKGISLLPSTPPIVGKRAIAKLIDDVTAAHQNARMKQFELDCFDIEVAGDWASEWCQEHQLVEFGDGTPSFEGRGKMLLVLHRDGKGKWLLMREMWNQASSNTGREH